MATAKSSPEQDVYECLVGIIRDGALPPGAKLGEMELAAAFGVSRERVRKVLIRLGSERILELIPNRGAFVPTPSLGSVREAFDARRMIEAGLAMFLASRLTDAEVNALGGAAPGDDRGAAARTKGETQEDFHLRLAKFTRNAHIEHTLGELVSRTSSLAPRGNGAAPLCGHREHEQIVAPLKQRNGAMAAELLSTHLSTMETRLRPPEEAATMDVSVAALVKERLWKRRPPATKAKPKAQPKPKPNARKTASRRA